MLKDSLWPSSTIHAQLFWLGSLHQYRTFDLLKKKKKNSVLITLDAIFLNKVYKTF